MDKRYLALILVLFCGSGSLAAQVYSPGVFSKGQVDTRDLVALAQGIYAQAGAVTPRQKAEAIWRFFLTDGRFVAPGFWYHIAGWAYEEPGGEVLDPLKLLNSYGFGLCYHIAPLLEAVWEAGGFEDARVWFLTGHTVAEVYYDGAYHYYDSDMLGYTCVGAGDPKRLPVASVRQIEQDGNVLLGKLKSPTQADTSAVDYPWYPADLREAAMGGLAQLFTSAEDNWVFPYTRYTQGHSMDFVLRPGERLTRYFSAEAENLFYLPFKFDGKTWQEFPEEVERYQIHTKDGPKSQKDNRRWSTGRLEYIPVLWDRKGYYPAFKPGLNENLRLPDLNGGSLFLSRQLPGKPARAVFEMQSAYVIIDAAISLNVSLESTAQSLLIDLSTDGGKSWDTAGVLNGPHRGRWQVVPRVIAESKHGVLTAVSGKYGYLVRVNMLGPGSLEAIRVKDIAITSRFQLNPRVLPELSGGRNELFYRPGPQWQRRSIPVMLDRVAQFALRIVNARYVAEQGQGLLLPVGGQRAEVVFELSAPDGSEISGFDASCRFLDIRDGLAPDKFTAEVRKTELKLEAPISGSVAWSLSPTGGYKTLWQYEPNLHWKDGEAIDRTLRWPEVGRQVRALPAGTKRAYVRYQLEGMALDNLSLAVLSPAERSSSSGLEITHVWTTGGQQKSHVERIQKPWMENSYIVDTGPIDMLSNQAVIFYCPATARVTRNTGTK
ncbi:MAG TPA: hypothetical protein VGL91_13725 [Acidobacteriota bacterium]